LDTLTTMIAESPSLIGAVLKHKEGKTFRFLIRNIFFLFHLRSERALDDTYEVLFVRSRSNTLCQKQIQIITEFFRKMLLEKQFTQEGDKKHIAEARSIFIKESLKNLTDSNKKKYPSWPELAKVFNVGSAWLMRQVIRDLAATDHSLKDKLEKDLSLQNEKFCRIQRESLAKSILYESLQK